MITAASTRQTGNTGQFGHRIWLEQKRILAEQGITWFSPADMNPGTIFD